MRTGRSTLVAAILAVGFVGLIAIRAAGEGGGVPGPSGALPSASAAPSIDPAAYLDPFPRPAAALRLTGPGEQPVDIAALAGQPVLVFFGYTHCPDVCPATIGVVGEAIAAEGGGAQAIFVSVDPARDTVEWLGEFAAYLPAGFHAATGTATEVRATADAWGVRYARVDTDDPEVYEMSHTADVFVIDGAGRYRGRLPFGTDVATTVEVLRAVRATTPSAAASPSVEASATPSSSAAVDPGAETLIAEIVSSSVWSGPPSPVILALHGPDGRLDDSTMRVTATVLDAGGAPVGDEVDAVAVQPEGVDEVSFIATLAIPAPGPWTLAVTATASDGTAIGRGTVPVDARDPGGTAPLGVAAPTAHTRTAEEAGGLEFVTTAPLPDPRLSATSTTQALAAGRPFVLLIDSSGFKVNPACGTAVATAERLIDRWSTADVPFIHHEPYRYDIVTSEPVIQGSLEAPVLTDVAEAWGAASEPWGAASMPWVFIVDGDGVVRARYQGLIGTADIDVILSMLVAEGGAGG